VPGSGAANNQGESGGAADEPGGSPRGSVRGRRGRSAIKEVREQIKKLLSEKKDGDFTEADKDLLRQYEGSGGLAEKGATDHGTLYEFYTPQKVVDKVWSLVDKYNPRIDKSVIEPSAGTGRFAENRLEKFDLFELDETSARIAGILHPDANIKQGYFQELFMNGRTPKKAYDGKKYDVAIGNPPYGDYTGLHRGLGEGKNHTRMEEYFIDRSLDTLKDGGILAMVVPSGFLRGKNSKAKQAIAGKARLLEAWRLPNGTFGTTGIGTDIIVLRKEHGDLMDFQNDIYFQKNEGNIVGYESEKMGRFGMEKYVSLPDGMGFDEALDSINPGKVPAAPVGELAPDVQAAADVAVSEAEEHQNRSEAMRGNQNARKFGSFEVQEGIRDYGGEVMREASGKMTGILETGKSGVVTHKKFGNITVDAGEAKNRSFGLKHIIKQRFDEGKSTKEIAALLILLDSTLKNGEKVRDIKFERQPNHRGRMELEAGGITAIVSKQRYQGDSEQWVLTGFGKTEKKEEAADTIQKVISRYGYAPEFLVLEKQVGAVVSSLQKVSPETGEKSSENRSQAMMGNKNAEGDRGGEKEKPKNKKGSTDDYTPSIGKNMTADELNRKYGIKVEKDDLPIWDATDFAGRIEVKKLSNAAKNYMEKSGNFTVDADGNWYSNTNYASGNIYDKLDQLESDKERIVSTMGKNIYDFNKSLLESVKLPPKAAEQIHFSPINDFVKEYKIKTENPEDPADLREAFENWANINKWGYGRRASKHWNPDTSPISEYEIPQNITFNDVLNYIWQIPQKIDKATAKELDTETARMEAAKKRDARRECAERLFNRFIREGLTEDKRKDLVETWNRRYNAVVNPDYKKIPVIIDGMNTHKGDKVFDMKQEQVESISFMCNKGNGISAANVGVGKTVIGESVIVNRVQTKKAERPLVVVPKAVYRKWIKEFHQHFPDMVINELQNFGDKHISRFKAGDAGLNIPEGTISVCTQEALQKITFKDETLETDLIDDMMDSQTIYDAGAQEKRSAKKLAEERQKMMERLGRGAKAKDGALYWEDCGFDCVMVDECFPYDTPVLTEKGWMKIGDIVERRENIRVYSCNYEQNEIELKPIIAWMPKRLEHKIVKVNLSNGESLTCTHNHKIWTENGYVRAEDVEGKNVFVLCKNMRAMREGILLQIMRGNVQPEETFLFKPLCGGISEQSTPHQGSGTETGLCNGRCDKGKENALPFNQNEEKQPYEEPRDEGKSSNEEGGQTIPRGTWGEWDIYEAANTFNGIAQFAPRICNSNERDNNTGCPQKLQGGPCDSREKDSYRIRRSFPQTSTGSGSGCEENSVFERVRVESVEILERGSFEQYGFRSGEDSTVYDIEVADNHNFIANSILVSNCHNFKNIFGTTRSFSGSNKDPEGKERNSNEFKGLTGGESDRAMKLFAITQLIQKQNNGQNVFGLSATPFTNSPIEVYNMLSLVARNKLKELHIYNMYEFLAQFAEIKTEWSVGAKGEVVEKEVMKNWKNLGVLQNLISEYMLYVDADEAGVIRPRKKPHAPQLELTKLQKAIIEAETDYMTNADPKKDPGATLKAITNMRMATLTPAVIRQDRWEFYMDEYPDKFKGMKIPKSADFVTASPKMSFVCDSVAKAYKKLPNAGQIIYLPRGVNDFVHVKQYLIDQGMPEDSIAFMSSNTSLDEKERIKDDFNDVDGKIKVIIGSETIKEGVSLNGNTHSIYNCMLGWNPTETIQVEGRAWRQGNKQGHVHVVYPLMADSIDSLMYQKYDEKSSRINEIWSYKGDTSSDVSDINPETLKFDLIKDPAKKARFIVGQRRDKTRADRRIEEARYEVLFKDIRNLERADEVLPECKRDMDTAESEMLTKRGGRDKAKKHLDELESRKASQDQIMMAKRVLDRAKWELEQATSEYRTERKIWKEYNDQSELYRAKFKKMGIRPGKHEDKLKEISASIQRLKDDETRIEESYNEELEKAKKDLAKQQKKFPVLSAMVDDNVSSIMGNLRPMDEVKKEIEVEIAAGKGVNKSIVVLNNRLFLKVS
jgi:hypothetical protein